MSIEELINELYQSMIRFEIERIAFPLFNRLLNEKGYMLNVHHMHSDNLLCQIEKRKFVE